MRATYQLNTEKSIIMASVDPEIARIDDSQQLKRKQNKLKDVLSRVMAKYQETD